MYGREVKEILAAVAVAVVAAVVFVGSLVSFGRWVASWFGG